jgi:hypothetical protein
MDATGDTAYDAEHHAKNYPPGIERLYWHRARNRILYRKLYPHLRPGEPVLEIGCASGVVVGYLRERGVLCDGVDLTPQVNVVPAALGHVRPGIDAFALAEDQRSRVRVLLLLDVLEHLPDPSDFLRRCDASFSGVEHILITLPARPEIWSNYDDYYRHYQRYTLESLAELRVPASFGLVDSGYFFHALYWLARGLQLFTKNRSTEVHAPAFPLVHELVGRAFDWEERLTNSSLPGSSLYALYGRQPQAGNPDP